MFNVSLRLLEWRWCQWKQSTVLWFYGNVEQAPCTHLSESETFKAACPGHSRALPLTCHNDLSCNHWTESVAALVPEEPTLKTPVRGQSEGEGCCIGVGYNSSLSQSLTTWSSNELGLIENASWCHLAVSSKAFEDLAVSCNFGARGAKQRLPGTQDQYCPL